MGWQERIEKHKQGQVQAQNEEQKRTLERQEQQRRENVEKIKPLLQVLEDLKCREMLIQIRDEVWKLGEVAVSPDLNEVTHETSIRAKVILEAKWAKEVHIEHWADSGGGSYIGTHTEEIEITAKYGASIGDVVIGFGVGNRFSKYGDGFTWTRLDGKTHFWLEQQLVEDCAKRGGSFDELKNSEIEHIKGEDTKYKEAWHRYYWDSLSVGEKLKWLLRKR